MRIIHLFIFLFINGYHAVVLSAEVELKAGNALTAYIGEEYGTIDNFLMTPSNQQSSRYLKFKSRFLVQGQFERSLLHFTSLLSNTRYQDFSQDDHSNAGFLAGYQYKYSKKQTFTIDGDFNRIYESRGTGISLGKAEQLSRGDSKNKTQFKLAYLYGQKDSVAKLSFSLGAKKKKYLTRRIETEQLDTLSRFVYSEFDYLMTGKTYISTRVEYEQDRFEHQSSNDRDLVKGLLGIKWAPSEITSLNFLFGYQTISFISDSLDKNSTESWKVDINWRPLTYTELVLHSARDYRTSYQTENSYRVVDSYGLTLTTKFTERLSVKVNTALKNETLVIFANTQDEEYFDVDASLHYQWRDWLSCFIDFNVKQVNSNLDSINFNQNSVSLGVNVNL